MDFLKSIHCDKKPKDPYAKRHVIVEFWIEIALVGQKTVDLRILENEEDPKNYRNHMHNTVDLWIFIMNLS